MTLKEILKRQIEKSWILIGVVGRESLRSEKISRFTINHHLIFLSNVNNTSSRLTELFIVSILSTGPPEIRHTSAAENFDKFSWRTPGGSMAELLAEKKKD